MTTPSDFEARAREIVKQHLVDPEVDCDPIDLTALTFAIAKALEEERERCQNDVWLWLESETSGVQKEIAISQMVRFKRDVIRNDLRANGQDAAADALSHARNVVSDLRSKNEKLTALLSGRDMFIVNQDLWGEFADWLKAGRSIEEPSSATRTDQPVGDDA